MTERSGASTRPPDVILERYRLGELPADEAAALDRRLQDDDELRTRLAALDRALKRLDDGSYGRSVRSGLPISDERLAADPAAELTIEEARATR